MDDYGDVVVSGVFDEGVDDVDVVEIDVIG